MLVVTFYTALNNKIVNDMTYVRRGLLMEIFPIQLSKSDHVCMFGVKIDFVALFPPFNTTFESLPISVSFFPTMRFSSIKQNSRIFGSLAPVKYLSGIDYGNLQIDTKKGDKTEQMDMTVLLISEPTLMPDAQVTVIKNVKPNEDKTIVKNILDDRVKEIEAASKNDEIEQKTYMNSFIVELEIENPPEDFNLHLLITPDIDIVSTCIFQ